jgi:hypothetical protein
MFSTGSNIMMASNRKTVPDLKEFSLRSYEASLKMPQWRSKHSTVRIPRRRSKGRLLPFRGEEIHL